MKAADALAYQRPEDARALLNEVMENIGEDNLDVVWSSLASIEGRQPGLIEEVGILDRLVEQADASGNKSSLEAYVNALAANDPEKAAGVVERISAHSEPQEEVSLRIGELARHWLSTDARAAADWFASLPDHTLASSVNTFLNQWARTDPESAQAWAESNLVPRTKAHGEALPFISEAHIHRGHYDEALKTLQQWPGGEQAPEHLYRNLVKSWHKEDPEAARRAFSSLPVASDLWERWVER